jgi:hypothetical protein
VSALPYSITPPVPAPIAPTSASSTDLQIKVYKDMMALSGKCFEMGATPSSTVGAVRQMCVEATNWYDINSCALFGYRQETGDLGQLRDDEKLSIFGGKVPTLVLKQVSRASNGVVAHTVSNGERQSGPVETRDYYRPLEQGDRPTAAESHVAPGFRGGDGVNIRPPLWGGDGRGDGMRFVDEYEGRFDGAGRSRPGGSGYGPGQGETGGRDSGSGWSSSRPAQIGRR